MKLRYLLFLGLASCTLLARKIDPCINNNPRPDQVCVIEGGSLQTQGNVIKAKIGDVDGFVPEGQTELSDDIVMLTDNAGSLRLEAILGPSYNEVIDLSDSLGITAESLVDFDLADVSDGEDLNHEQILILTTTEVLIADVPSVNFPILRRFSATLQLGATQDTSSPAALVAGNFREEAPTDAFPGNEVALAYRDASTDTADVSMVVVLDIDTTANPDTTGTVLFVTGALPNVADVLEIEAHNINSSNNNATDEFMLITTTPTGESDAILFINAPAAQLEPTQLRIAGQLGGVQFVDINDDDIFEILVGDASADTVELIFLQSINNASPVKNLATSQIFDVPGTPQAVSLARLSDRSELILAATADTIEVAHRKVNDEIELLNTIPDITNTGVMFGFDANRNGAEEMYIPNTSKELQIFIPNFVPR